jgi:PAS domain S-box-containing protein
MTTEPSEHNLAAELADLRTRLAEAEKALRVARDGTVHAVAVRCAHGEQVVTRNGVDRVYRQFIETMSEGTTLSADGVMTLPQATDDKRQEQVVASEVKYRRLFESAKDGILILDAETGTVADVNPFLVELLGFSHEAFLGKKIWELESFKNIVANQADFAELQRKEYSRFEDKPLKAGDGRRIDVEFVSNVYLENHQKVIQCNIRDITERKRAEEALRESQQILEGIINAIPVRVFWKDKNLVYLGCNTAFARDAGFADPKDIVGKDDYQMGWRDQAELYRSDDRQVIESACPKVAIEEPQTNPEGNTITLLTSKLPLRSSKGEISGVLGTYVDTTERKRSEETMLRAISALKTLSSCSTALVHARDEESLLNEICRIIVVISGYRLAWVGFAEHDPQKTVRPVAHAGYIKGFMERAEITWGDDPSRQGPAGKAIRTREPQLVQDAHTDPRYELWRDNAIKIGYRSVLCLPLVAAGTAFGALCIYAADRDAFDNEKIRLLSGLANELAFGIVTLRARAEHHQSAERLRSGMESTIEALAGTLELRDAYTAGHQRRVAELAAEIAREMGVTEDEVHGIHLAATVHDLGKIQVPAEILTKPTRLTNLEYEFVKTHAQAGYDLLKDIDFPWPIAQLVYQHHERLDGSGYPRGLRGEDTLMGAKIIAVADTVEAMSSHRPYRAGLGITASLAEITKSRDKLYDAAVVDACVKLFREKRFAFSTSAQGPRTVE